MPKFNLDNTETLGLGIKKVAIFLGISLTVFLLITKVISPKLLTMPDVKLVPLIVYGTVLFIYLVNASMHAWSLNEIRRILNMQKVSPFLLIIPVVSEITMREYYEELTYIEDDRISSTPMLMTIISSLAFALTTILTLLRILTTDVIYMTPSLLLVYTLFLITFTALSISRSMSISEIIDKSSYRTYMLNPKKYKIISLIIAMSWVLLFIITPIVYFLGIHIVYPLLNVLATIFPIVILPILTLHGITQVRKDIERDFDIW